MNLRTDSNNDGAIDADDELVEDISPGRVVFAHAEQNGLAQVDLNVDPSTLPASWAVSLSAGFSSDFMAVWGSADKTDPIDVSGEGTSWAPGDVPQSVWVEGIEPGVTAQLELKLTNDEGRDVASDVVKLTIAELDLDIVTELDGVIDDAVEADPGAFVHVNNDDNDQNGVQDRYDAAAGTAEDDLLQLRFENPNLSVTEHGRYFLEFNSANLNIWDNSSKVGSPLQPDQDLTAFQLGSLYAEGTTVGATDVVVKYADANDVIIASDTIHLTVVETDALSVPEFLFASATYDTPVKFTILGAGEVYIHSVETLLLDGGTIIASDSTTDHFGSNDGFDGAQNNGDGNTYTVFLSPDTYNGLSFNGHATENAKFLVRAVMSATPDGPRTEGNFSYVNDEQGQIKTLADEQVFAVDIPTGSTPNQYNVDMTAGLQADVDSTPFGFYEHREAGFHQAGSDYNTYGDTPHTHAAENLAYYGIEAHDQTATAVTDANGAAIGVKLHTRMEDAYFGSFDPPATGGNVFLNALNGWTRGGYWYVSYGGQDVPWLGEKVMDLTEYAGNFDLTMFNSAQIRVTTQGTTGPSYKTVAAGAFGIGWALPNPLQPVFGVGATVVATLASIYPDGPDAIADVGGGYGLNVLARTPAKGTKTYEAVHAAFTQDSAQSYTSANSNVVGKSFNVGDQWVAYTVLASYAGIKTRDVGGVDVSATTEFRVANAADWTNFSLQVSRG